MSSRECYHRHESGGDHSRLLGHSLRALGNCGALRLWRGACADVSALTDKILDDPHLVPIEGTFNWYLDQDFQVQDDILGLIVAKKYFITDLGSIPRIFWNIIPPLGPATLGYVIHDWLYSTQSFSRAQSDDCLLRLMGQFRVGWAARHTVYWALRACGWVAWNEDAKKGPQFYPSGS